jgi:hypothetical protein
MVGARPILNQPDRDQYIFVMTCPHAISRQGVYYLVQKWSIVIIDGFAMETNENEDAYKMSLESFSIR